MKKISFYCMYERLGASSRLRIYQYIPILQKKYGIKVNALLTNQYVSNLYSKRKQSKICVFFCYVKRFIAILFDRADIIIIEKELFPYLPFWVELVCLKNKKYIIDIDDAVFLKYTQTPNWLKKVLLAKKFNYLFAGAEKIFAGSPYLLEESSKYNPNSIYIPTSVELSKYMGSINSIKEDDEEFVSIGWIGTESTVKYLRSLIPVLELLASKYKFELVVIGAKLHGSSGRFKIRNLNWSESEEVALLGAIDVGIMPLDDNDWEKGKCAYKLIQYMACAKPVVGSRVGANSLVIDQGVNGCLCDCDNEWFQALSSLICNREMRYEFGQNGREKVKKYFSTSVNSKKIIESIEEIICVV